MNPLGMRLRRGIRGLGQSAVVAGSAVLRLGLRAFYSLEDATDDSGNGLTLTAGSGGVSYVAAKVGNGVDIAGAANQHLRRASGSFDFTNLEPRAAFCWTKLDTLPGSGSRNILSIGTAVSSAKMGIDYTPTLIRCRFNGSSYIISWSSAPATATWYFICCWFDGTTGYISVNDGTPVTLSVAGTGTNGELVIGAAPSPYANVMDGIVDQLGIYGTGHQLDVSAYRTWLYNAGSGRSWAEIQAYTG